MKYLFALLICVFAVIQSKSQTLFTALPVVDSKISYVHNGLAKLPKEKLFLKSKDWSTLSFKNYKDVVQLEDKDLGRIYLNGTMSTDEYSRTYYKYRIAIECVDEKYRFTLTDIFEINPNSRYSSNVPLEVIYGDYLTNAKTIDKLKSDVKLETKKKEIKKIEKDIFDRESNHIIDNRKIKAINKELVEIMDSYKNFMAQ